MQIIDFRSDTVTKPTPEMRRAMYEAPVGDDVYGDDPTVNRLEALGAEIMGKEAAVFVPSGTMGNQVALMAWTQRGDEIILEEQAHIFMYEVGGPAVLSSVMTKTIRGFRGAMDPADVKDAIRGKNIHFPKTTLICLENTHNRSGGCVIPLSNMRDIYELAREASVRVHLDGARVFNAALALGVEARELAKYADSVQFCLSKGLCAPVGSLVAGSKEFVDRARGYRKMLGGGMRQAGILAAAGIVALEKMVDRLAEDHANARMIGEALAQVPGLHIDLETVQTNMVAVGTRDLGMDAATFSGLLRQKGVWANASLPYVLRIVTHHDVSREACQEGVKRITDLVMELRK
ncbi:MAG: low-specificity L-threonine aldolase [Bacillota bacterium]|jgi:threonine aldolase